MPIKCLPLESSFLQTKTFSMRSLQCRLSDCQLCRQMLLSGFLAVLHKLYLWSTGESKKGRVHLQRALCCNAYQDSLQELHLAIPSPTNSEPPASFGGCQQQAGDQSTSSIAACRARHISQPLCTQATGLFYQPASRLVPAPARTSQLEARGCDKAGLGDGGGGMGNIGEVSS